MRETDFIGQNKEKWTEFESVLRKDKKDAEKLSQIFVETTDDLSFSRTYYPNRSVRVYLNGIAQKLYHRIYKNRKEEKSRFTQFWTATLPDAMWFSRRELLVSFLIFVLGIGIGILSSAYNPEFVKIILGEGYVTMTEENIQNGDPLGVYKNGGHLESFLTITWNNIQVGILCFVLGLLFEVGTIFVILSNAIMVGAFLWFFVQRDLLSDFFFSVMLHGTLELSMIVLAGAAGLTLGRGLVFPGSYTRLQAFLLSARHGLQIMIGVSAFLVIAGFIEGFATRYSDAPNFIRGMVIFLSLAIVLFYFVWCPWKRNQQGKISSEIEKETIDELSKPITFDTIKTANQISNESWVLSLKSTKTFLLTAVGIGIVFTGVFYLIIRDDLLAFFDPYLFSHFNEIARTLDGFWFWDEANNFFMYQDHFWLFPVQALLLSVMLWLPMRTFRRKAQTIGQSRWRFGYINALLGSFVLLLPFLLNGLGVTAIVIMICIVWWPFWMFTIVASSASDRFLFSGIGLTRALLKGLFGRLFSVFLMVGAMQWVLMAIVSAPLFYLIFEIVGSNFAASLIWVDDLIYLLHTFFLITGLCALLPVMVYSMIILFYSNSEITSASALKTQIEQITFKKRAYGLERE